MTLLPTRAMDPAKHRFEIARYGSAEPPTHWLHDHREAVRAICIGPESDLDACYIFPRKDVDSVLAHTQDNVLRRVMLENLSPKAIKVSVERPFVGYLEGPFVILPRYSKMQRAQKRAWPFPETNRWPSDDGAQRVGQPFLELQFYSEAPLWLPTERAPYEFSDFNMAQGGAGIGANTRLFPGWGRRRIALCLEMVGRSSGTLTWSFSGYHEWQERPIASALGLEFAQVLGSGVEAADFDRTYLYDGMFDWYLLSLTDAGAALDDDTYAGFLFEAYDR